MVLLTRCFFICIQLSISGLYGSSLESWEISEAGGELLKSSMSTYFLTVFQLKPVTDAISEMFMPCW